MKLAHKIIGSSVHFLKIILVMTLSHEILDRTIEDSVAIIYESSNDAEVALSQIPEQLFEKSLY